MILEVITNISTGEVTYVEKDDPVQELIDYKYAAKEILLHKIAKAREGSITILPGQDMIYLAKEAEAKAYLQSENPNLEDYPLLLAETGITTPTSFELAQLWLNLGVLWRQQAAQLEALRMVVNGLIEAATTKEQVDSALSMLDILN